MSDNTAVLDELYGRKRRTSAQQWVVAGAIFNALILVVGLTAATSRTLGGQTTPKALGSFAGAVKPGTGARFSMTMDMHGDGKAIGLMRMDGELVYQKAFHAKYTNAPKDYQGMEFWALGTKGWARVPATRGLLVSFPIERSAQDDFSLGGIEKRVPGIKRAGSELVGGAKLDHWVAPVPKPPATASLPAGMHVTGTLHFWISPVDQAVRLSKATITTSMTRDGSGGNETHSFTMEMTMQIFDLGTPVRIVPPKDRATAITQARLHQMLESPQSIDSTYGAQGSIVALGSLVDSFSKSGVQGFTGVFAAR